VGHGNGSTGNITIERNYIHDNGYAGSSQQHNAYTETLGIVYQFNRFGPLKPGSVGNNIKDRSAGTVIRYNWVEGGNTQLDLVESLAGHINGAPGYQETFVYGNVLVEPAVTNPNDSLIMVHYGGDTSNTSVYRNGWLYFHANTCVSLRTAGVTVFGLNTASQRADARNNVIHAMRGPRIVDSAGYVELRSNWLLQGWYAGSGPQGAVADLGGNKTGSDPMFQSLSEGNFTPKPGSPLVDAAGPLGAAVAVAHKPSQQYVKHQKSAVRPGPRDPLYDIGAMELNRLRREAE